jgi:hypothetical protein
MIDPRAEILRDAQRYRLVMQTKIDVLDLAFVCFKASSFADLGASYPGIRINAVAKNYFDQENCASTNFGGIQGAFS